MKVTVKYDDRGASRRMRAIRDEVDRMINDEIHNAGSRASMQAKQSVPVDKVGLKSSIIHDKKPMMSVVGAYANYAPYVEFGTKGKTNIPKELSGYAQQFKGKGEGDLKKMKENILGWMHSQGIEERALFPIMRKILREGVKAQPFLYPAFFSHRDKLNKTVDRKIADIFRKNSRG